MANSRVIAMGVLALLWVAVPAGACSCVTSGDCGAFRLSDPTFVGKVIGVTSAERPVQGYIQSFLIFRFSVIETFSGKQRVGEEITVETGTGGGDCGYPFIVGNRYLVDGYKGDHGLSTSICSGTEQEDAASPKLRQLRAFVSHNRLPALIGRVATEDFYNSTPLPSLPLARVDITISAPNRETLHTTTDNEGVYSLATLAPGNYSVVAELPPGYTAFGESSTWSRLIKIPSPNGAQFSCLYDIYALPAGRIAGEVVDRDGHPIQGLVFARKVGSDPDRSGASMGNAGSDGRFTIFYLSGGDYLIELRPLAKMDTQYYPGTLSKADAKPVHVEDGKATQIKLVAR